MQDETIEMESSKTQVSGNSDGSDPQGSMPPEGNTSSVVDVNTSNVSNASETPQVSIYTVNSS